MLRGGPGAGMSIGNMSTHISSFPCSEKTDLQEYRYLLHYVATLYDKLVQY